MNILVQKLEIKLFISLWNVKLYDDFSPPIQATQLSFSFLKTLRTKSQ